MQHNVHRVSRASWLIALSCAFLALAAAMVVGPRLRGPDPAGPITVTASPPGTTPGAALVKCVFVDGRRIPLEEIERDPGWLLLDGQLFFEGGAEPAALRLNGSHACLVLAHAPQGGTVRLAHADGRELVVDCRDPDVEGLQFAWYEIPGRPPAWWLAGVALLGLGLLAWLIDPARGPRRAQAWIVLHAGIAHALTWMGQPVGVSVDSGAYVGAFENNFAAGRADYFPPGYPVFVALVRTLSGASAAGGEVTALQGVMLIAVAVWVFRILGRVLPSNTPGLAAGLFLGSSPTMLLMGRAFLSEALAVWAITGTLYFAWRCQEDGRLRHAALAGLCAGIATVTRVTPAAIVGPILLLIALPLARQRGKHTAIALALMVTVAVTPLAWFAAHGNPIQLSNAAGGHIFNRMVYGGKLLDRDGPSTQEFLRRIDGADPFARDHVTVRWAIEEQGYSAQEIDDLQRRVAFESLAAHPVEYMTGSLTQAAYQWWSAPGTAWAGWYRKPEKGVEEPPALGISLSAITWMSALVRIEGLLWPLIAIGAAVGALCTIVRRRHRAVLGLVWIAAATALSDSMLEIWTNRRSATISVYLVALAALGVVGWRRDHAACPAPDSD